MVIYAVSVIPAVIISRVLSTLSPHPKDQHQSQDYEDNRDSEVPVLFERRVLLEAPHHIDKAFLQRNAAVRTFRGLGGYLMAAFAARFQGHGGSNP